MNILAQSLNAFAQGLDRADAQNPAAPLGYREAGAPINALSSLGSKPDESRARRPQFSRAANTAFEQGDPELGRALHHVHLQTSAMPRLAKTLEGAAKEDGLRQIRDMLLAAQNSPAMFERTQSFAARNGVPGAVAMRYERVPAVLGEINALLADPDSGAASPHKTPNSALLLAEASRRNMGDAGRSKQQNL